MTTRKGPGGETEALPKESIAADHLNHTADPGQIPPTEAALAGALMLLDVEAAQKAAHGVDPLDISDPRIRAIYRACMRLVGRDVAPDPVAVLAELRNAGTADDANKIQLARKMISDMYESCPHAGSAEHYAALVLEDALRRRVTEAADRLRQAADESPVATIRQLLSDESTAVMAVHRRYRAKAGDDRE